MLKMLQSLLINCISYAEGCNVCDVTRQGMSHQSVKEIPQLSSSTCSTSKWGMRHCQQLTSFWMEGHARSWWKLVVYRHWLAGLCASHGGLSRWTYWWINPEMLQQCQMKLGIDASKLMSIYAISCGLVTVGDWSHTWDWCHIDNIFVNDGVMLTLYQGAFFMIQIQQQGSRVWPT